MSSPREHGAVGPATLEEVSDGIDAYLQPDGSWYLNNTGFLVSSNGVLGVDATSTERRTRAYLEAIAGVTDRPVRTLLNTHHHGDHTYGNYLFPGATIVGHERTREELLAAGPPANRGLFDDVEWGDVELAPPFLTYDQGVTLWADDLRCEVSYVGTPAHTTNDSIVWIPERSVLFCGDLLVNGGTPFLRPRRPSRHGGLQRRPSAHLPRLTPGAVTSPLHTDAPRPGPVTGPGHDAFAGTTPRGRRPARSSPRPAQR